jgi:hypothetical protein
MTCEYYELRTEGGGEREEEAVKNKLLEEKTPTSPG